MRLAMSLHHPSSDDRRQARPALRLAVLAVLAVMVMLPTGLWHSSQTEQVAGFVGTPSLRVHSAVHAPRGLTNLRLRAEGGKIVDMDTVDDEEEEFEASGAIQEAKINSGAYPPEAYAEYSYDEDPPSAWFDRRKIDRHKVNTVFFDMYKKPKSFFPHKLQPGDTVRVSYLDPVAIGEGQQRELKIDKMRTVYFDGVILNFRGEYHARTITLRAMVGKGENVMGSELQFPMHSPLVKRISVLRRGYIGRNKNAYFIRGMIGKRNVIPLDQERTEMDNLYASLRESGRTNEIPESDYPMQEWDRYPLPVWKQDMDEWDEEKYAAENVDQRSQYEVRVIGKFRKRVPGPSGRRAS